MENYFVMQVHIRIHMLKGEASIKLYVNLKSDTW